MTGPRTETEDQDTLPRAEHIRRQRLLAAPISGEILGRAAQRRLDEIDRIETKLAGRCLSWERESLEGSLRGWQEATPRDIAQRDLIEERDQRYGRLQIRAKQRRRALATTICGKRDPLGAIPRTAAGNCISVVVSATTKSHVTRRRKRSAPSRRTAGLCRATSPTGAAWCSTELVARARITYSPRLSVGLSWCTASKCCGLPALGYSMRFDRR